MKYFLHLSYQGTNYRGWQRQKTVNSVQETIESAFFKMLKKEVAIIGCGRTDAEVHASQFVAHIQLDSLPNFDLIERLNLILPSDIAIHEIKEVRDQAHAQFDAVSRTYTYFIHHRKSPFLAEYSSYYPKTNLSADKMLVTLQAISTISDFRSLCISPDTYKHTICRLGDIHFYVNENEERIAIQVTSNRFLRGMMRLLIGNLLAVGYGQIKGSEFIKVIKDKNVIMPARYAYPQGLYLSSVRYPNTNFDEIPNHNMKEVLSRPLWVKLL